MLVFLVIVRLLKTSEKVRTKLTGLLRRYKLRLPIDVSDADDYVVHARKVSSGQSYSAKCVAVGAGSSDLT